MHRRIQFICIRIIVEIYGIISSRVAILFLDGFHGKRQDEK